MYAEEVQEHFAELGARVDEVEFGRAFSEQCVPALEAGFTDNFAKQSTAGGQAWAPRKDPKPKHPLLILTSALVQSVGTRTKGHVERADQRTLELGTDLPYAGVHQFGAPRRNIVARPFLDVTDDTLDACGVVIGDHFEQYVWGAE